MFIKNQMKIQINVVYILLHFTKIKRRMYASFSRAYRLKSEGQNIVM
jgi:hypothetical protein